MFYLFSIFLVLFVIYTHKINQPLLERFPISYLHTILYHSWFTIPSILSFIVSFLGFYNICYSLVSIQPAYCSIYSFCHPIFDNSVIIFFVSYGFSSLTFCLTLLFPLIILQTQVCVQAIFKLCAPTLNRDIDIHSLYTIFSSLTCIPAFFSGFSSSVFIFSTEHSFIFVHF